MRYGDVRGSEVVQAEEVFIAPVSLLHGGDQSISTIEANDQFVARSCRGFSGDVVMPSVLSLSMTLV